MAARLWVWGSVSQGFKLSKLAEELLGSVKHIGILGQMRLVDCLQVTSLPQRTRLLELRHHRSSCDTQDDHLRSLSSKIHIQLLRLMLILRWNTHLCTHLTPSI